MVVKGKVKQKLVSAYNIKYVLSKAKLEGTNSLYLFVLYE